MLDMSRAREMMVERQIARRGVRDAHVTEAMRQVPREVFVPEGLQEFAYEDNPLPIAESQTISQPYIVALMLEAAEIGKGDRVLEVGAGSGYAAAVAAQERLNGGTTLFAAGIDASILRELNLLTTKPFLYVFNADEAVLTDDARVASLRELVAPADAVFLDAKIESELQELDDESAAELLESIGQTERGLDALARAGFHTLRLQTYLTAGPKESRAWTIHQGDTAPKAAGVIHTDFEKGFIKAEIVSYDDLIAAGSMSAAKAAGKVRMEGKDYVMADGDVVEFRFNV